MSRFVGGDPDQADQVMQRHVISHVEELVAFLRREGPHLHAVTPSRVVAVAGQVTA